MDQLSPQKETKGSPEEVLFYFAKRGFVFLVKAESHLQTSTPGGCYFFSFKKKLRELFCTNLFFFPLTVSETHCLNPNCWGSSNSACFPNTLRSFNDLYLIGVFICLVLVNLVQLVLVANIVLDFRFLWREKHRQSKCVR